MESEAVAEAVQVVVLQLEDKHFVDSMILFLCSIGRKVYTYEITSQNNNNYAQQATPRIKLRS